MEDGEAFEPEATDEESKDEDMGLLEEDSLLEKLFKLSSEISVSACTEKKQRPKADRVREVLDSDARLCSIMTELPDHAKDLITQAVVQLSKDVKMFGVEYVSYENEVVNELNIVVSEIYSPPKVAGCTRPH